MITKFLKNMSLKVFFSGTKAIQSPKKYSEKITLARAVMPLYNLNPMGTGKIFVAPNATIVGQVFMGHYISIGHGTVIRGDINSVRLHHKVIIGDNCVLHTAGSLPNGLPAYLELEGENVVQHGCTLYSCYVKRRAFIGFNSVILQGAVIEQGAIIAPNSVVPPGRLVPALQVWGGNPIKFIRYAKQQQSYVTINFTQDIVDSRDYMYKYQFLPYRNAYLFKQNQPQEQIIRRHHIVSPDSKQNQNDYYSPGNPTI